MQEGKGRNGLDSFLNSHNWIFFFGQFGHRQVPHSPDNEV